MKKCGICKTPKILTDFGKNKSKKDGLQTECRECGKIRSNKYKADHKEEIKAYRAQGIKAKPTGRKPKRFAYKGRTLTMSQVMALPECNFSRVSISNKLNAGKTIEEILHPPTKEERDTAQKLTREEKARQRVQDKQIIKNSKADIERQRIIKIMAVPVHPMKTALYWLMKSYTYRADSSMEPIKLRPNGGW